MFSFLNKSNQSMKITEETSVLVVKVDDVLYKSFLMEQGVPDSFMTTCSLKIDESFFFSKEFGNLYVIPYNSFYALTDDYQSPKWMFVYSSPEKALQDGTKRFPNSTIEFKRIALTAI